MDARSAVLATVAACVCVVALLMYGGWLYPCYIPHNSGALYAGVAGASAAAVVAVVLG